MSRAVAAVLLVAAPAVAADPSAGDLAVRARAILRDRCGDCHSGRAGQAPRPILPLLDHAAVVAGRGDRPRPADLLLDLVADGSMPPGDRAKLTAAEVADLRAWVAAGAAEFPPAFDDPTALRWVADDFDRRPTSERPYLRYLTFHHLLADGRPPADLAAHRRALADALGRVTDAPPELAPVDPTGAVVRWDLRAGGWHRKPFRYVRVADDRLGPTAPLDLFDVVLLEYPFGVPAAAADPVGQRLRDELLLATAPVRPVAAVRADWLAAAVADRRLAADLRRLVGRPADPGPAPTLPADAPADPFAIPPPDGAMPPIDGFYAADPPAAGPAATARVVDRSGRPADRLRAGDEYFPKVSAPAAGRFELLMVDGDGVFVFNPGPDGRFWLDHPGKPQVVYQPGQAAQKRPYRLAVTSPPGDARLVTFFAPDRDLFPPVHKVRAAARGGPVERYFHRLPGLDWGPLARVARTTARFAVDPPGGGQKR